MLQFRSRQVRSDDPAGMNVFTIHFCFSLLFVCFWCILGVGLVG